MDPPRRGQYLPRRGGLSETRNPFSPRHVMVVPPPHRGCPQNDKLMMKMYLKIWALHKVPFN